MNVYIFLLQSVGNVCEIFCSAEWFQQQQEFTNKIENMEVNELKKCLAKFHVSVRKTDGSYYKKSSFFPSEPPLDRHLKAPPNNKKFFFFTLSNNHKRNYTKTISRLGQREFRRIVTSTSSR